jgi:hypothetical protein
LWQHQPLAGVVRVGDLEQVLLVERQLQRRVVDRTLIWSARSALINPCGRDAARRGCARW